MMGLSKTKQTSNKIIAVIKTIFNSTVFGLETCRIKAISLVVSDIWPPLCDDADIFRTGLDIF